ncbi:hypothetical protein ACVWXO_006962 [Bradyrhizobium sp. LM2.7]
MAQRRPLAFFQRRTNGAIAHARGLQMTYRWMAEIQYNNGEPPEVATFEELAELHDIVELGPDWNTIEQIVTLNRPSVTPAACIE